MSCEARATSAKASESESDPTASIRRDALVISLRASCLCLLVLPTLEPALRESTNLRIGRLRLPLAEPVLFSICFSTRLLSEPGEKDISPEPLLLLFRALKDS